MVSEGIQIILFFTLQLPTANCRIAFRIAPLTMIVFFLPFLLFYQDPGGWAGLIHYISRYLVGFWLQNPGRSRDLDYSPMDYRRGVQKSPRFRVPRQFPPYLASEFAKHSHLYYDDLEAVFQTSFVDPSAVNRGLTITYFTVVGGRYII